MHSTFYLCLKYSSTSLLLFPSLPLYHPSIAPSPSHSLTHSHPPSLPPSPTSSHSPFSLPPILSLALPPSLFPSSPPEPVWKVARYTTAAPMYFKECDDYVDGGVLANNPSETGLTAIQTFHHSKGLQLPIALVVCKCTGTRIVLWMYMYVDVQCRASGIQCHVHVHGMQHTSQIRKNGKESPPPPSHTKMTHICTKHTIPHNTTWEQDHWLLWSKAILITIYTICLLHKLSMSFQVSIGSGIYPAEALGNVDVQDFLFFGKQWLNLKDTVRKRAKNLIQLLSNAVSGNVTRLRTIVV